ncbi:MAG: hypothetical protein AB7R69_04515 [Candidatus Babeliales bacterium]
MKNTVTLFALLGVLSSSAEPIKMPSKKILRSRLKLISGIFNFDKITKFSDNVANKNIEPLELSKLTEEAVEFYTLKLTGMLEHDKKMLSRFIASLPIKRAEVLACCLRDHPKALLQVLKPCDEKTITTDFVVEYDDRAAEGHIKFLKKLIKSKL